MPFEEPKNPDLVIQNDGEHTPLEVVEELEQALYHDVVETLADNPARR